MYPGRSGAVRREHDGDDNKAVGSVAILVRGVA